MFKVSISRPKSNQGSSFKKPIIINDIIEQNSSKIINLVGYIILLLATLDLIASFVPPKFFDPVWELNTIGKTIETVWAPIIAFMLIFYRRKEESIKYLELRLLAWLSRLALIMGIIYLLTIPLLITNSFRIFSNNRAIFNSQLEAQEHQVTQINQQLNRVNAEQLNIFAAQYKQQKPELNNLSNQEVKQSYLNEVKQKEQKITQKLQQQLASKKKSLAKISLKWILGALISGVSFICIWKYTAWTRAIIRYKQQNSRLLTIPEES